MRITFRLKNERDDDLLIWFKDLGEGERSFFIRQALRRGLGKTDEITSVPIVKEQNLKPMSEVHITAEEADKKLSSLISNL